MIPSSQYRFLILLVIVGYFLMPLKSYSSSNNNLDAFYNLPLSQLGKLEITSATGNSTPLDRAPATASVITAAEIKAMGARNLDEVLESVPGLHVSLSSLSRLDSVYSIRGIHTGFNPHVLLLINGVPVTFSLYGGKPALLKFPVTSIAQVEIIRGPGSAIYGADAYSGVINIITRDSSGLSGSKAGGRIGSFGYKELWLQNTTVWNGWSLMADFTYQHSNGDNERVIDADLQTTFDGIFGTQATLAPNHLSTRYEVTDAHLAANNENWKINLWHWRSKDAGVGAGAAQALDFEGHDDSELLLTDVTYKTRDWIDNWEINLGLSYLYYELQANFTLLPAGTVLPIGDDGNVGNSSSLVAFPDGLIGNPGAKTNDLQFDIVSIYQGWDNHRVRLAVGAKHQALDTNETKNFGPGVIDGSQTVVDGRLFDVSDTSFVFAKDVSRTIRYLSIQEEWRFSADWELTAGLRYDEYSDFGGTTNPRVAVVWSTSEKLTTKLLYGSAFRAPSFSELFFDNNPVSLGRPDLDPEVIDTWELSFNLAVTRDLQSITNLFYYQAKGMIEFVPDDDAFTKTAKNARDQDGIGFEWEVNWRIKDRIKFGGNYSWTKAKDRGTKNNISDAPMQQLTLAANFELGTNLFLNGRLNWVADRNRADGDPRENVPDYSIFDLSLRKIDVVPGLDFSISAKNVMDKVAYEPSSGEIEKDYPLEGRSTWIELTYHFD